MTVTREQARQALEATKLQFALHVEDAPEYGPKLIENWDWLESGPTPWAIVWEDGPYEWAYRAQEGGMDEEATILARDIAELATVTLETPAAPLWPVGVFAEPVTSWAVGLYLI